MDQRFQQTLNFNLNDVPVRFNLSSTQPLPENFVVNTVRSLVQNASTAIGYTNETTRSNSQETPTATSNSASANQTSFPNSTAIPMSNEANESFISASENEDAEQGLSTSQPLSNEQQSLQTTPNGAGTTNQAEPRAQNTREIVNNLLPHVITMLRLLIVLFGKHLSGYFLNLALCISLIFSYWKADETVKRLAYSEQPISWRSLRSVFNNLFLVSTGLALAIWLYFPRDVFWLCIFNINPENWSFGNIITTATTVVMLNYFIKCDIVFCKLILCATTRCKANCLPLLPNVLNFLDVFGHLYLCSVVVCFWFIYVMRGDGNFGVGMAIFIAYIVSRVPHFLSLLKDCVIVVVKLTSCRTHGRRATKAELDQATGCAICLQDGFRTPTVVSCNHVFCHTCISRWLLENRSCPVCRKNLLTGNDTNFQSTRGVFFM